MRMHGTTHLASVLALGLTLATGACLREDKTSTIYLRQDGSFDWVVLERNVRSDADDEASRTAEELTWAQETTRAESGIVNAMLGMGGRDVRVRWLRGARPFAVTTDARFDSLPGAFDRALAGCRFPYENGLSESDGVTTWTLRLDVGPGGSRLEAAGPDCGSDLEGLSDLLDGLRIVLESGTFTGARGFAIEGGDSAVIDDDAIEASEQATGLVELSLSWR